jgi:hypothetical protein
MNSFQLAACRNFRYLFTISEREFVLAVLGYGDLHAIELNVHMCWAEYLERSEDCSRHVLHETWADYTDPVYT